MLALEEGNRGSRINSMGDAMWWSIGTVTTVGSGDVVPHTAGGRWVAAVLMLAGVGFIGTVVSNFAVRFFGRVAEGLAGPGSGTGGRDSET
jgi:voltage-gated potassium channel